MLACFKVSLKLLVGKKLNLECCSDGLGRRALRTSVSLACGSAGWAVRRARGLEVDKCLLNADCTRRRRAGSDPRP